MKLLDTLQDVSADPMVFTISSALLTHLYFKRYEPRSPKHTLSILLGVPSFLSLLNVYAGWTPASTLSTLGVLGNFVTYLATLIGSISLYRISPFHPLAQYPGPLIAKLSKLWMLFICSTGKPHEYQAYLHEKYGDIVRTGPNEVMIRDPAAIQPLMGTSGWGKSAYWSGRTMHGSIPPLIGLRDGPEHMRRRRTWNRGFNPAAMKEYGPMVHKRVLELLEVIVQRGHLDLCEILGYFAFDVMTDIGLGGGTNMMSEGDSDSGFPHTLGAGMRTAALLGQAPWIGRYAMGVPGVGTDLKLFRAFANERCRLRLEEGSKKKDLLYHLADEANIEKEPIPTPVIFSDASLVVAAGADTTATVLSSLFFYLLQHPEKFKRLRTEIDNFYPTGEEITAKHFGEMHYLDACINEALRLSPPVPSGSQRAALHPDPSRGRMLGPYYIPEGNSASINFLATQRDPRNFSPFPNTFWPDRWLVAKGLVECPLPGQFAHETSAFVPFSFGPGACVGKPLAVFTLRMTTAYIVRDLELEFASDYKETWESDWRDYFVIQKGKLPVVANPRV